MVKLYSLQNSLQRKEYMDVLKKEHIPCYSRESESGEYLKIPNDVSSCGMDLYIDDENQKQAKSLLKSLRQQWDLEEMQSGWKEDEDQPEKAREALRQAGKDAAIKAAAVVLVCGVLLFGIWLVM